MNHPVRKKGLLAALVVFFSVALTPLAWGQDAARNVSKEQVEEARELFKEGVRAQREANWEQAYDALRKSYNLRRSFDTAANLGVVEVELKRYPEAAEHLDYWLRHYPTSEDPERYARVQALFEQVRPLVGGVKVEVNVPGARIFVNDEPVGSSPIEHELFVEAGKHFVSAEFQGKKSSAEFEVENGATAEVRLSLDEQSSAPASGRNEGDSTLDGRSRDFEQTRAERNWVPAYVLGGVTVAALGTSLVFRGLAGGQKKKADELRPSSPDACVGTDTAECSDVSAAVQARDTFIDAGNVSLIVSGVAAAATIGYVTYVLSKKKRAPGVNAALGFDSYGGSISVSGRF